MRLQSLELSGFKSFARKTTLVFRTPVTAIVGPNGSGKSNSKDAFLWVLGEQSLKSLRGKRGEDLIWNGSTSVPRSSRASVALTFDNNSRSLPLDLDTVTVERVMHRDGANEYALNGTRVRLKDVTGLLAQANIGSSGHHIISQGEADRMLTSSPSERRAMVEDALGLRIYHFKLTESVKKLAQTEENIRSVEALRREIAPHLAYLKKQAARLERARALAQELVTLYRGYSSRAAATIAADRVGLEEERTALTTRESTFALQRESLALPRGENETRGVLNSKEMTEAALRELRAERETVSREIGRIEGMLVTVGRGDARSEASGSHGETQKVVPFADVEVLASIVSECVETLLDKEDLGVIREALRHLEETIVAFITERRAGERMREARATLSEDERERLQLERERVACSLIFLSERECTLIEELKKDEEARTILHERSEERDRALLSLKAEALALQNDARALTERETALEQTISDFKREQGEIAILLGRGVFDEMPPAREQNATFRDAAGRAEKEKVRRDIERLRIRLEEAGSAESVEILKEYETTAERDAFLARELNDLTLSRQSLETLMEDLRGELGTRFRDGLKEINIQFQEFFSLLFDGGRAAIVLTLVRGRSGASGVVEDALYPDIKRNDASREDKNENRDVGLDVEVTLPHKRLKGLEQLSGGERALTSIALTFAISQVHPPPFLILDETDAALDEANSRRYADLIERLAERSQLILITHNRETMSRAGILYGVTMGSDGVSQLLSVRLDEAVGAVE